MYRTSSQRHKALLTRDPHSHAAFIYCVITTKIYCRPTCPSRLARRSNIVFHESSTEAEAAGFRACKRCRPNVTQAHGSRLESEGDEDLGEMGRGKRMVDRVKGLIEMERTRNKKWTVKDLATEVGLTQSHFCRVFKKETGGTVGEYRMSMLGREEDSQTPQELPAAIANRTQENLIIEPGWEIDFDWDTFWNTIHGMPTSAPDLSAVADFEHSMTPCNDVFAGVGDLEMEFIDFGRCEVEACEL